MLILLTMSVSINAQENANTRQARQIFDKTYNMVFGPQGCNLSYAVNIVGVYKTEGTSSLNPGFRPGPTERTSTAWTRKRKR